MKDRDKINTQKRAWYARNKDRINNARRGKESSLEAKVKRAKYRKNYVLTEEQKNRATDRVRRMARNRKIKAIELLGGACTVCGLVDDPAVYDFHHRDPTKKDYRISRAGSWAKMKEELEKCDLVCSNCHRKIHIV